MNNNKTFKVLLIVGVIMLLLTLILFVIIIIKSSNSTNNVSNNNAAYSISNIKASNIQNVMTHDTKNSNVSNSIINLKFILTNSNNQAKTFYPSQLSIKDLFGTSYIPINAQSYLVNPNSSLSVELQYILPGGTTTLIYSFLGDTPQTILVK